MKKIRWKSMLAFLLAFVVVVSGVPTTQVKASDVQEENMDGENDTTEETKERSEDGTKANAPSNAGGSKSEDDGTKMDVEAEESEDETIGKSDEEAEEKDKKSEDETAGKSDGEVDKKSEDETDGKPDEEVEEDTEESEGETAAKPEEDTEESEGETGSKSDEEVEDKKSEDETNSKSDEEVEDKKSEDETNSKLDEEADEKSEVEGEIDSDGITLLSDGDITPPVIDESSIVFLEEGQEIVPGSDIHITFSGYDVESELSPENTKIDISIEDRAWFITASAIEKTDEDKNEYKVSFTFETYWESGEYEIDSITIGDTEKNINKIDFDENSRPKFTVSELVNESVVIKSITLSKDEIILNDKTTSDTIFVEIVAEGDGKDDSKPFHLEFEYQDSYGNTCTYPADVYYQLNDGLYKAQIECDFSYPTATTYTLVRVTYDGATVAYNNTLSFTIKKEKTDVTTPEIEFVKVYRDGAEMEAGCADLTQTDILEIHVGVKDEHQIDRVDVDVQHHLQNVGDTSKGINMEYNSELGCYVGTLSLSDMYATEWSIDRIYASDIYGNYDDSRDYSTFNFYIKDSQGNTSIPTFSYNVKFKMGDGSEQTYSVETTRITTIREMFPNGIPCSYEKEGFEFLGWYIDTNDDRYEKCVSETEEFVADGYDITIYPVYDKREITVNLSYMNQEGYNSWKEEKVIVDSNATYKELLDSIESLGIEHYDGLTLKGWESSYCSEEELINIIPKNVTSVSFEAEYEETFVQLCVSYLSEDEYFKYGYENLLITNGTTYRQIIDQIDPTKYVHYSGVTFKEWKLDGYDADKLNEVVTNGSYVNIYAVYKENPISVDYIYYNADADIVHDSELLLFENDVTYNDVLKKLKLNEVTHADSFGFTGEWKVSNLTGSMDTIVNQKSITFEAQYTEKNIVDLQYFYYNKQSQYCYYYKGILYQDGDTYGDIIKQYVVADSEHRAGFTGWTYSLYNENYETCSIDDVISGLGRINCDPNYEQSGSSGSGNTGNSGSTGGNGSTGSLGGSGSSDNSGSSGSNNATAESTVVTKPEPAEDAKELEKPEEETVEESEKPEEETAKEPEKSGEDSVEEAKKPEEETAEEPEKSGEDSAEKTEKPREETVGETTEEETGEESEELGEEAPEEERVENKPAVKLEEEIINQKVEEAQKAEEGTALVIEMAKEGGEVATEVPVAVLEAVRGKDVNIVLDMGGYSWTINGQDVLATDLSAINLEVTMDTEAVAPSIVEKLAGGEPVRQISLTHNGDFGFKASLTINVGSEHEGEFGNLYYHDNNGKLVFMNAGQIDGDGNVSLNFSHASDYVVVVGRDRTEEENKTEEESMHVEIVDEEAVMIEEEMKESGNDLIPVMIILIVVAAAAGIIFVKKNKK